MATTAHIFDKGGVVRLMTLEGIEKLTWERIQDDISKTTIRLRNPGPECIAGLERVTPMRHEVVLTRGGHRVWEGPITLLKERGHVIEIEAHDILYYFRRMAMAKVYDSFSGFPGGSEPVPARLHRIMTGEALRFEQSPVPPNVRNSVVTIIDEKTARTSRRNEPYEKYVWEEMDEMAWRNGVDYTAAARKVYIHDTDTPLGHLRAFSAGDFVTQPEIAIYGAELATQTIVTDRQGRAAFGGIGNDDYYGRVELMHGTYYDAPGEEADDQSHVPIEEMEDQARRDFAGRYPLPIQLRVPENAPLNPATFEELGHELIPGVRVPLSLRTNLRQMDMMLKLRRLHVTEDASGERATITLIPAPEAGAVTVESGGVLHGWRKGENLDPIPKSGRMHILPTIPEDPLESGRMHILPTVPEEDS